MPSDPTRIAIYNALAGEPSLTAIVGSRIHFQFASQGSAYPLAIFHRQSRTPSWTFAGPPVERDLWTVVGVAEGSGSATVADEIADAIDAALNDAQLVIEGHKHLLCLRDSGVQYAEVDDGSLYRRSGATYRVLSE